MISTVILKMPSSIPHKSVWVQITNVITWMAARNLPLESHTVGIMGILVHCPVHVGSRLLGTGDSFGEVSRSLGWPRQWLYLPFPHCPLK